MGVSCNVYADTWLAGYDGKPIKKDATNDLVAAIEVFLWGGDFDDKQDAELEQKAMLNERLRDRKPVSEEDYGIPHLSEEC